MKIIKRVYVLVKRLVTEFLDHEPWVHAAAISFYSLLSLSPLLVLAIAVAGLVFGEAAAKGELETQINDFTGDAGAEVIQTVLANASGPNQGIVATVIGTVMLLIGASTVFSAVQKALNHTWNIGRDQQASGLWGLLRFRVLGLGVVLLVGMLLVALLIASWLLQVIQVQFSAWLRDFEGFWTLLDLGVALLVFSLLIGTVFKLLPETRVPWSRVWLGAILTALMFVIGRYAIGFYLSIAAVGSAYGAAGSLVALLVWMYYSALIFLIGAEITHIHTKIGRMPSRAKSASE